MKKIVKFSKFFPIAVVLSAVLILAGVVSLFVRGVNFGLDFKPGMMEEIRIAPTVIEVTYNGSATVSLETSSAGLHVVVSGVGAENKTVALPYAENKTSSDFAAKLNAIEGVNAKVLSNVDLTDGGLFVNSSDSTVLGTNPYRLFAVDENAIVSADEVRAALKNFSDVDVKSLGVGSDVSYQIRMGVSGDENSKNVQARVSDALVFAFGADKVSVIKSDFIGAQFSKSLISSSIILVIATLLLIFIYATIRFHWDFALASVIAIVHDTLIMISFISWSQMEFCTTTLAALLTIIGYSINATVVILDRVRNDLKVVETKNFKDVLDSALSATLSRSIITTVTTLFAVLALYFFTTGTIHDFALALTVGLISGCYSSIFISSAFIALVRKNYKFDDMPARTYVSRFQPEAQV